MLLKRNIIGIGIDTLSPDRPENGFPVHNIILDAGKYIVENIANSSKMPATSAYILIMPMKIKNGTKSPVRLVGLII